MAACPKAEEEAAGFPPKTLGVDAAGWPKRPPEEEAIVVADLLPNNPIPVVVEAVAAAVDAAAPKTLPGEAGVDETAFVDDRFPNKPPEVPEAALVEADEVAELVDPNKPEELPVVCPKTKLLAVVVEVVTVEAPNNPDVEAVVVVEPNKPVPLPVDVAAAAVRDALPKSGDGVDFA